MKQLLLGCGSTRDRRIGIEGRSGWDELVTLDHNADHGPDVVHDLEKDPVPIRGQHLRRDPRLDPSHTRVITSGTLVFLSQDEYRVQVGQTAMSDFRFCYSADFQPVSVHEDSEALIFVLRAKKILTGVPAGM